MRLLLIDNYDSFTYLLAQYLTELSVTVDVVTEDDAMATSVLSEVPQTVQRYDGIVISPGPKTPADATFSLAIVRAYQEKLPILGVCLGHQIFAYVHGGHVIKGKRPEHGQQATLTHHQQGLLAGLPSPMQIARYHSLVVDTINDDWVIDGYSEDGVNQAMHHRTWPLYSVQFHPESLLTENGHAILANFLTVVDQHATISTP